MKKNYLIMTLVITILAIIAVTVYFIADSDKFVLKNMSTQIANIPIQKTNFMVKTSYLDGKIKSKIKGTNINSNLLNKFGAIFGDNMEILEVVYLDESKYPIITIEFNRNEISEAENEMTAVKAEKLEKKEARKIRYTQIVSRKVLIVE